MQKILSWTALAILAAMTACKKEVRANDLYNEAEGFRKMEIRQLQADDDHLIVGANQGKGD